MIVGFTGTRHGMTNEQVLHVHMLLGDLQTAGATEAHHGMCVGADKAFHDMAKVLEYRIIGHPGVTWGGLRHFRAECPGLAMELPPRYFLERNRTIVSVASVMIATPCEPIEQRQGSGTWATIRYAREADKPLIILWPDGTGVVERVPGVETPDQYREGLWV